MSVVSYAFAGVRNVPSKRKMRKFEQQFIQKKWPLSWVFLLKTPLTMRYLLRGKPSSNAYLRIKSVKRVKRETAPSSESAQCILAGTIR